MQLCSDALPPNDTTTVIPNIVCVLGSGANVHKRPALHAAAFGYQPASIPH